MFIQKWGLCVPPLLCLQVVTVTSLSSTGSDALHAYRQTQAKQQQQLDREFRDSAYVVEPDASTRYVSLRDEVEPAALPAAALVRLAEATAAYREAEHRAHSQLEADIAEMKESVHQLSEEFSGRKSLLEQASELDAAYSDQPQVQIAVPSRGAASRDIASPDLATSALEQSTVTSDDPSVGTSSQTATEVSDHSPISLLVSFTKYEHALATNITSAVRSGYHSQLAGLSVSDKTGVQSVLAFVGVIVFLAGLPYAWKSFKAARQ